ncbi:hypothetical protein [Streptomyces sp. NBC_01481]|uniref:hypothetical protein n=1 Tax=Streptomyces sp. NBC_01481 TaxID=2975869 RepID=UPI00224F5F78|nr:hypothetical protein [Streptomyces sp. NBC_01481]MCX4587475.1 hypothetical protein [Streptomyces sp. NBC_01481]
MSLSPDAAKARAAVAANERWNRPEQADNARRDLRVARLSDSIRDLVETAPLPTPGQLARLRALLGGGND